MSQQQQQQQQQQPHGDVSSLGEHAAKPVTMADALEAASMKVADKPMEWGDVAAIRAAEARAAGRPEDSPLPGGMAEEAHAAAEDNAHRTRSDDKIKLGDILMDATELLPRDKVVTTEDAKIVEEAERRHNPTMDPNAAGGVAATVAAAARINQNRDASS